MTSWSDDATTWHGPFAKWHHMAGQWQRRFLAHWLFCIRHKGAHCSLRLKNEIKEATGSCYASCDTSWFFFATWSPANHQLSKKDSESKVKSVKHSKTESSVLSFCVHPFCLSEKGQPSGTKYVLRTVSLKELEVHEKRAWRCVNHFVLP